MVGERFTRASELAAAIVAQMDRRDRFRRDGVRQRVPLASATLRARRRRRPRATSRPGSRRSSRRAPATWSARCAPPRAACAATASREPWVLYIGDGFASTGFRRVGDVERAVAGAVAGAAAPADRDDRASAATPTRRCSRRPRAAAAAATSRGCPASARAPRRRRRWSRRWARRCATRWSSCRPGLSDVAPTVLPTLRAGEEVLIAAGLPARRGPGRRPDRRAHRRRRAARPGRRPAVRAALPAPARGVVGRRQRLRAPAVGVAGDRSARARRHRGRSRADRRAVPGLRRDVARDLAAGARVAGDVRRVRRRSPPPGRGLDRRGRARRGRQLGHGRAGGRR